MANQYLLKNWRWLSFDAFLCFQNLKERLIDVLQIPVQGWYDIIGEKTIADAVLDRLIHQTHRIELHGEPMRKKKVVFRWRF